MSAPQPHQMVRFRETGLLQFAHRGGAVEFPENTMLAFRAALEMGLGCIETDVHLSKDGHLVLFHDSELDRTTDGSGPLSNYTLEELKSFDAGYQFRDSNGNHNHRGKGLTIPGLSELAELPGDFIINVDMKSPEPELQDKLLDAIVAYDLQHRIIVASEFHARLTKFRRLAEERFGDAGAVPTSASRREAYIALALSKLRVPWAVPYQALQLPPTSGKLEVVTRSLVKWAHTRGVQVHVWTIDDPEEMQRLAHLGADGLMTDRPSVLKGVLSVPSPA